MTERFHQSYAKTLLGGCPAELRWKLDNGWAASRAMDHGSVVDQLLFGGLNYHEIDADSYRTDKAKQERDAARTRGQVPILKKEARHLVEVAGGVRADLQTHGVDLSDCIIQPTIQWIGADGVHCEGTPDLVIIDGSEDEGNVSIVTVDLKCGAKCSPDWLDRQVYEMYWDVQAAAYGEAVLSEHPEAQGRHEHWIVRASTEGHRCVTVCPLDEAYMTIGRDRLSRSRCIWEQCLKTNEWPEYESRPLTPPAYAMAREMMI